MKKVLRGWSAVMVALCAIFVIAWIASASMVAIAKLPVSAGGTRFEMVSYRGLLSIFITPGYPSPQRIEFRARRTDPDLASRWNAIFWTDSLGGLSADERRSMVPDRYGRSIECSAIGVTMPYWLLLTLGALVPVQRALLCWRERRRVEAGLCATCGYTVDGVDGPCPACTSLSHPSAAIVPSAVAAIA